MSNLTGNLRPPTVQSSPRRSRENQILDSAREREEGDTFQEEIDYLDQMCPIDFAKYYGREDVGFARNVLERLARLEASGTDREDTAREGAAQ